MNLTQEQIQHMVDTMTPNEIKTWVQNDILKAWKGANCRGTAEAATGVGKTRLAVLAAAEEFDKNPEAVVYVGVPTETLRDDDWPKEFEAWGYGHLVPKVKFICHASMDSIKEEREEIDLFVFDEIHNITPVNAVVFDTHRVYKILGLSATLPNMDGYINDQQKRLLINRLAPSIYKVTVEEAVALKLVSDFEVYVMKVDLDKEDRYVQGGTKKKPALKTEVEQYQYLTKMLSRSAWMKPEMKFVWIQKRMAFLYSLRQKKVLAREVMDHVMTDAKRTLIFCGSIDQCGELCGENVYHSKVDDTHLKLFQEGKIPYLGVVQALNEGKNIENLDQILVIQLNSKELDIVQRIGRTIRFREGHKARVIVLVAKDTVDEKWYKEAFKNFDKKRIKEFYVKPTISARAA